MCTVNKKAWNQFSVVEKQGFSVSCLCKFGKWSRNLTFHKNGKENSSLSITWWLHRKTSIDITVAPPHTHTKEKTALIDQILVVAGTLPIYEEMTKLPNSHPKMTQMKLTCRIKTCQILTIVSPTKFAFVSCRNVQYSKLPNLSTVQWQVGV